MKSKTDTRKEVIKSQTTANVRFPSEDEWVALQKTLGVTLSADLKGQIGIVTMLFANVSPAIKKKMTVREVQKEIGLWHRRTEHVRKHIWETPAKEHSEEITLKHVSERYRKLPQSIALKPPLALLAEAIDAALLTSKYVIQHITRPNYPGTREQDLWMIWVALVVTLLNENDISVK